ncbi:hypothetical protein FSP39_001016 [Pinctada imbricata]|uniref:Uncharacterized protein n=1 Tax=Pinctada imbricata TaxID=66713 RepID=A0AA88XP13_PINIB|nr:hypothetical protein FSP39_001016 [Pinctada imbricata]
MDKLKKHQKGYENTEWTSTRNTKRDTKTQNGQAQETPKRNTKTQNGQAQETPKGTRKHRMDKHKKHQNGTCKHRMDKHKKHQTGHENTEWTSTRNTKTEHENTEWASTRNTKTGHVNTEWTSTRNTKTGHVNTEWTSTRNTKTGHVNTEWTSTRKPNESDSLVLWMTFAAVCSIILILVIYISWSCWKRTTSERKQFLTKNGQHLVHPVGNESVHSDRRDASTSTPIGGIQDSPTGREGPHVNLGDHRLLHDISSSESSIDTDSTARKSCETGIPLQPTVSGHVGTAYKGFECTLLDETQRRFVSEEQHSNVSCDSGFRDNSSPSNRSTNRKTIEDGATQENCPLLTQCTQDPTEETTCMKTFPEPVTN